MNQQITIENLSKLFGDFTINLNLLWIALVIGIVMDFATGIAKAYKENGKLSSSKLRDGGFKKCGIIFVVIMSLGLSKLFCDTYFVITNSVIAYYIYTEIVSIIENLNEMGIPLPPIFIKIIGKKSED